MSERTETMNLKEAFAYMNFLNEQLRLAVVLLDEGNDHMALGKIGTNNSYLFNKRVVRNFSRVNPDKEDTEEDMEKQLEYDVTADELICFLEKVRKERETCSLAISAAKKQLSRDLDVEISLNKERHLLIKEFRALSNLRDSRVEALDKSFKFDNDGRQTVYNVPAMVYNTVAFDRSEVRRKAEELSRTAKEVSNWIDRTMVTTNVDFVPAWDINDSFENIVKSA